MDTMVTTREVPWMKLGKITDKDVMTAEEATKLGGLDFTVSKRKIAIATYKDKPESDVITWKASSDKIAVVRDDTEFILGYMSPTYPLLQNAEAFDFMDGVAPHYVAAGALKKGRQPFVVVKAPETITVLDGEDTHELFLVLRTSHDGSRAVEVMAMPLRDRCMNQLSLQSFAAGVPHRWSIKHTGNMQAKMKDAQDSLKKLGAYANAFENNAHKLTKVKITDDDATDLLEKTLPNRPKREQHIERIITTWHQSDKVGFDYTGWGLLNAVSEDYDWGRSGGTAESRFIGALQGQTHTMLNRVAGRLLSRV